MFAHACMNLELKNTRKVNENGDKASPFTVTFQLKSQFHTDILVFDNRNTRVTFDFKL